MKKHLFLLMLVGALTGLPLAAAADTDIKASNESDDTEMETGEAHASNSSSGRVGHEAEGDTDVEASDIENSDGTNVQEGDNEVEGAQNARANSGSTVGGQIIGAQVDGNLTVDATNLSENIEAETGDATADNAAAAFVGLGAGSDTAITSDITNAFGINLQEGDNSGAFTQNTEAVTGDAVAGQIFGATATGSVDATLANTSDSNEVTSGDADEIADTAIFSGLNATGVIEIV